MTHRSATRFALSLFLLALAVSVPAAPNDAVMLRLYAGKIIPATEGHEYWFRIPVEQGTRYVIACGDSDDPGAQIADTELAVFHADGATEISLEPHTIPLMSQQQTQQKSFAFVAAKSETILIRVTALSSGASLLSVNPLR